MENNNPQHQNEENIQISKKNLYIGLGVLAALLIAGYFIFFFKKDKKETTVTTNNKDSTAKALVVDSSKLAKDSAITASNYDEYGEEGSPYSEYRVISKSVTLPNGILNYGDKVYVDDVKSTEKSKVVFIDNPMTNKNAAGYTVDATSFIDSYQFDEFKSNFSLAPFSSLAPGVKKLILDVDYSDSNQYKVTQNADRAKSAIAYGDYDGDGITDVAVMMDNNEEQISRLVIICTNNATKQPYLAYAENYSDKMKVRSFKKGASVYMNSSEFVKSPRDGVIITGEGIVLAIIYDAQLQKFKTYTQEETAYTTSAAE